MGGKNSKGDDDKDKKKEKTKTVKKVDSSKKKDEQKQKDSAGYQNYRGRDEIEKDIKKMIPKDKQAAMIKRLDEKQKKINKGKKMCIDDYEHVTIIGRGAFGEVWISRLKSTKEVFALKRMRKKEMVKKHQTQHIRAERDVLALADNPWIVQLHYSFQDNTWLYLAMEFLQGGDLMTILIKKDVLSEDEVRFYMAELALAVHSVHELNYIHRDLKPDNILFDNQGHLKLSDFGLCKSFNSGDYELKEEPKGKNSGKQQSHKNKKEGWKTDRRKLAHSMVGTPDYMAPEIFQQGSSGGYGKEVDWWSIGVIMYECLVGYAPFYGDEPLESARKIVNFEKNFHFPEEIKDQLSPFAKDLMHKLVSRANERANFVEDLANVKRHPFFRPIDWDNIRSSEAPIVPELKNDVDASMFDEFEEFPTEAIANVDGGGGRFEGFTYKNPKQKKGVSDNTFQAPGADDDVEDHSSDDSEDED